MSNKIMQQAIKLASQAEQKGEVPIAAIITKIGSDNIVAEAYNEVEQQNNAIMHAEIIAITKATKLLNSKYLSDCAIYVTLEPCAMCAQALAHVKIGRLYYAATDPKGGGVEHGACVFHQKTCNHLPEIYSGMMENESRQLLQNFFQKRR